MEHTAEQTHVNVTPEHSAAHNSRPKMPRPRKKAAFAAILLCLLIIAAGIVFYVVSHNPYDENKKINTKEYQAIFLTNGQVYFGKLADLNHKYVTITDIYYLQVQSGNSLQDASGSTTSNSQVSLAKLGNELHGPEDQMHISSDQVLFWENLKGNSKVVQAITKYQNQ